MAEVFKDPGPVKEDTAVSDQLTVLGHKVTEYKGLETFNAPDSTLSVLLKSDEVTTVCPVTNQPDWYRVEVEYHPGKLCIESKTFKLFLHSFRNVGVFCEQLASCILKVVVEATRPKYAIVRVVQKPRGGVEISALSEFKSKE